MHELSFQMFKLVLEKAEEPEIKLPTSAGSVQKDSVSYIFLHPLLKSPSVYSNWTETHLLVSLSLVLQFCFFFFFFLKPPLCPFLFLGSSLLPFSGLFIITILPRHRSQMTCLLSHSPPALMDKIQIS